MFSPWAPFFFLVGYSGEWFGNVKIVMRSL
jgi:hypothetical protein